MTQAAMALKFRRLVAVSVGVTAVLVAAGALLLQWRTGEHRLSAAAVAATAALIPLLAAGALAAALAWRCGAVTACRLFAGTRLTAMRFSTGLALLALGVEVVGVCGGTSALWFALLYGALLLVEACWLAGGARRSSGRVEASP